MRGLKTSVAVALVLSVLALAPTASAAGPATAADLADQRQAIWSAELLAAYAAAESDPPEPWDADARAFLANIARWLAADADLPRAVPAATLEAAGRTLLANGCDNPAIWGAYGLVLAKQGLYGEAAAILAEAIAATDDLAAADLLRGLLAGAQSEAMKRLGEPDLATHYIRQASSHFARALGQTYARDDHQRAVLQLIRRHWFDALPVDGKWIFLQRCEDRNDTPVWTFRMLGGLYLAANADVVIDQSLAPAGGGEVAAQPGWQAMSVFAAALDDRADRPEAAAEILRLVAHRLVLSSVDPGALFTRGAAAQRDYRPIYANFAAARESLSLWRDYDKTADALSIFAAYCLRSGYNSAAPTLTYPLILQAGQLRGRGARASLNQPANQDSMDRLTAGYAAEDLDAPVAARVRLIAAAAAFARGQWPQARAQLDAIPHLTDHSEMIDQILGVFNMPAAAVVGRIYAETSDHADALADARRQVRAEEYDQAVASLHAIAAQNHDNGWVMAYLRHAVRHVLITRDLKAGGWVSIAPFPDQRYWRTDRGRAWVDSTGDWVADPKAGPTAAVCTTPFGPRVELRADVDLGPDHAGATALLFGYEGWLSRWHAVVLDGKTQSLDVRRCWPAPRPNTLTAGLEAVSRVNLLLDRGEITLYVNDKAVVSGWRPGPWRTDLLALMGLAVGSAGADQPLARARNVQVRRLPDDATGDNRDATSDPVAPIDPTFAGYDDLPTTDQQNRTVVAGAADGDEASDHCPGPGWLAGLRIAITSDSTGPGVEAVEPVYQTPIGLRNGRRFGQGRAPLVDVLARDGFALGGLVVHGHDGVTGLQAIFLRINADGTLDAGTRYHSQLYGRPSDAPQQLGVDGRAVMGIVGRVGPDLRAIGLITTDAPNIAGQTIRPPLGLGLVAPAKPNLVPIGDTVTELNGLYYRHVDLPVSLAEAQRRCEALGGRLAIADSRALSNFLFGLADGQPCWVGVTRTAAGAWQGVDGRPVALDYWVGDPPAEPAPGAAAAIGFDGEAAWALTSPHARRSFVCQWDADPRVDPEPVPAGPVVEMVGHDVIYDGHRYRAFDQPTTWPEAMAICRQLGGDLVTIDSEAENQAVTLLVGDRRYFIGATDEAEEGYWQWVDGRPVEYAAWADGEPNNMGGQQHVALIGHVAPHAWDDLNPAEPIGFICEWSDASAQPPDAPGPLPVDTTGAFKFGEHWYKVFYEAVTWNEARAACDRLGGRLTRVEDEPTRELVRMLARPDRPLWIGASRPDKVLPWVWTDGTVIESWETPNGTDELIAAVVGLARDGRWQIVVGSKRHGSVCQWNTDPSATTRPDPAPESTHDPAEQPPTD